MFAGFREHEVRRNPWYHTFEFLNKGYERDACVPVHDIIGGYERDACIPVHDIIGGYERDACVPIRNNKTRTQWKTMKRRKR